MNKYQILVVLSFFLSATTASRQENTQHSPVVQDSTKQDSALVEANPTSPASNVPEPSPQGDTFNIFKNSADNPWWFAIFLVILAPVLTFLLQRVPRPLFNKAERQYRNTLRKEQGKIKLVGPGMDDISVRLDDTFVQLRISGEYRVSKHPGFAEQKRMAQDADGFSPDELLQAAFVDSERALLLIIGDPGSGKTTLIKYYTMRALSNKGHKKFGFKKRVLPIFLPLREVNVEQSIAENLATWCSKHHLKAKAAIFEKWLQTRHLLVLLDGLDEVRDADLRQKMCTWIDNTCSGLATGRVIVTSRPTGYRGKEKIVLQADLLQADIHDFSLKQREEFLRKWFTAAFLRETHLRDKKEPLRDWKKSQRQLAETKTKTLLDFLASPKNKSLRELSGIPMLLQIMAILWKKDDHLPRDRSKLYGVALDYLLEYRDAQRGLDPLLPAEQAQRVLAPACLWMQENWQHEEVPKKKLHDEMQKKLKNIPGAPGAKDFCENLCRRSGILAENSDTEYIFRHKSFREFFAGLELARNYNKKKGRLRLLANGFFDDWWEEPLRFFINKADGEAFKAFMAALFRTRESEDMNANLLQRLITLVEEAPEPDVSSLSEALKNADGKPDQQRAILACLKAIGTEQAQQAISSLIRTRDAQIEIVELAQQIIREKETAAIPRREVTQNLFQALPKSFHNPLEYNAEYLLIPGGQFHYSLTNKIETVPDLYFAKYPVTNRRYRRFISYVAGEETDLSQQLPLQQFGEKLLEFAGAIPDYQEHLGQDVTEWADTLKSKYNDDRKFNGDDQPVVGVTWFAARAYCFWLALFEAAQTAAGLQQPVQKLAGIYRLPKEMEWERAAAGLKHEKDAPRKYPWGKEEPDDKRANYDSKVGATTRVGQYPAGATPEGLQDMAGNVWEWQENWYDEHSKGARSLRGGSWGGNPGNLACAIRGSGNPVNGDIFYGFRVVRSQSVFGNL